MQLEEIGMVSFPHIHVTTMHNDHLTFKVEACMKLEMLAQTVLRVLFVRLDFALELIDISSNRNL